jgi:tetratricopeptide (TPR) repeat protein
VALAETSEAVLEIAEALEALEAATRPGAPPAPALLARGLLLARLGRRGDARAALATAVGLDPGLAAAREALARLRSLPDEPAPAPIEGRFSRAALAGADPVKLLARAEAELARRPRDPAPARALAAANAALGRHERALAEARRAVALGPGDPVSLALLAEITAQGSGTALPLALIEARAAARAAPRAGGVRALEGVLLLRARRAGEAVPALETAAAVWPRDAEVRRVLGEALLAAGDPDRAAAELSAAIALAGPAANDGSARLLATARARSLAGRDEAPPAAAPLAPGDRITVAVEPGGVRVHALEAGRARLLRLAFEAPRSAPSILELVAAPPGGPPAVEKRIEASPGARLAIDGIAPEAGLRARVTVRPGGGPDAYALALAASREDPAEFEVEPDDDLPRAVLLAPGHRRRGIIAPPGDVDCFRLVSPPGAQSGALDVRAPRAASLEVRILRDGPAGLVALEEKAVAAGASAAFAVPMEDGERLFAVISGAAGTAAPVGDDAYALAWRLAPAAGAGEPGREAEPNDRPEWATAVPCGARIAGEIRPAGDVDWLRLAPPPAPGGALALTLAADGGPALSVSIIARRGARFGTLLDTVVRPGAPLAIPRFALPPGAEVLVRLGAAPDGPPAGARWHLSVDAAAPDPAAEVEPDDDWRDALPLELGAARTGELSPAGDRDWYRIDAARPAGPLGIEVTGAAGVRRRLDVYARGPAAGALTPVVSAEVGPGEPLRIDALAAPAGELLVCLSARAQGGPYRIVADREASIREKHGQGRTAGAHQAIGGGVEHRALRLPRGCDVEPNDAGGALAPRLGPGETALGRVTWSGDRDPFVVTLGPAPATLALTAPADAPAALEVYARDATGALTRIGGARAAAGATAAWGPLVAGSEVTVVVTGPRASRSAYRLEVQR